ncbi:MAG: M48 family metallopeptidase [Desulfobacterales bacterium]|nr:M48 family metallopeptidase [Desulfobacterales bacterium]
MGSEYQNSGTRKTTIAIAEIPVEVFRKNVKNLNIRVYPPDGKVRVSAPLQMADHAVRTAIAARLPWIRQKQHHFAKQVQGPVPEALTGEIHYFQGRALHLKLVERPGRSRACLADTDTLELQVPPQTHAARRLRILENWYRRQLRQQIPDFVQKWEPIIGVRVAEVRIRRMKTRWGSCNIDKKRIWLNLELIKKPAFCLEYVVVHEMTHLLERNHTKRFYGLMDRFLPNWRPGRDELDR